MSSGFDDPRVCPYSDPALCRICSHDCHAEELADLIEKLEAAALRVRSALEEARRRIICLRQEMNEAGSMPGKTDSP